MAKHERDNGDSLIGTKVSGFVVQRKLGEGGMGAVYLLEHEQLPDIRKALKVLLPAYSHHPGIRARFNREARATAKLAHENIVTIDNVGELADGSLWLMLPFLQGEPLDEYLRARGGVLNEHRALHLVLQLCSALHHAHEQGIVHRDLKPSNLFIVANKTNPYMVKLLDFGIAKMRDDVESSPGGRPIDTRSGVAVGTPHYMAVEQYENANGVTPHADQYAAAIIAWELVTGSLPWGVHDPAVLYYQQRTVVPEYPAGSSMSRAWYNVLRVAIDREPSQRYDSVKDFAVALASATPAAGSFPSGAEILSDVAPGFVEHASPHALTVRNRAQVDRVAPLLWPARETDAGLPPLPVSTSTGEARVAASLLSPGTIYSKPLAVAYPQSLPTRRMPTRSMPTTISGASGFTVPTSTPARRWKLGLLAAVAAAVTGVVTFGVASTMRPAANTPGAAADDARRLVLPQGVLATDGGGVAGEHVETASPQQPAVRAPWDAAAASAVTTAPPDTADRSDTAESAQPARPAAVERTIPRVPPSRALPGPASAERARGETSRRPVPSNAEGRAVQVDPDDVIGE